MLFNPCYRCPECEVELRRPVVPHFQSNLHLLRGLPCRGMPEFVIIASATDARRGYVLQEQWDEDDWVVESDWQNPPKGALQVAVFPLPPEYNKDEADQLRKKIGRQL